MNNLRSVFHRSLLASTLLAGLAFGFNVSADEASYNLTAKDANALVSEAMVKAGAGNAIKVAFTNGFTRDEDIVAQATTPLDAQVDDLQIDKLHNHFQATLLPRADGKNLPPVKVSGHYDEMSQVPELKRPLQPGELISESDIEMSDEPLSHIRKNIITDPREMVGKTSKRVISQGRPIRQDEIANQSIIKKGERVTMIYKSPAIIIKTLGEAMESGAKGDVIRVKNIDSKSIVQGTVEAGNVIRITSVDTTAAEAM